MNKDFYGWNTSKIKINNFNDNKFYHSREVWWCSLGINIGYEQDGTGDGWQRPVLIFKGFSKNVCIIIPLTTSKKSNPYYFSLGMVDGKDSFAIISQIRLIDTRRLINKIHTIDNDLFARLRKTIKDLL